MSTTRRLKRLLTSTGMHCQSLGVVLESFTEVYNNSGAFKLLDSL
uniref:Uncharacterized protein n=1 Tax=Peronospora matthiolae TaxID=2874970 RepID=A0AAV1VHE5_9STRA